MKMPQLSAREVALLHIANDKRTLDSWEEYGDMTPQTLLRLTSDLIRYYLVAQKLDKEVVRKAQANLEQYRAAYEKHVGSEH